MSDGRVGWSFLYSRRWIGYFAIFVVFAIVCVMLGNWQFDRRGQARAEITRIDNNYDASPVALAEALPELDSYDNDGQKWLTVTATGHYEGDAVLARNRPGPDGVGANIVAPFRTDDGAVFFVDRGWVHASSAEIDEALENLPEPASGTVDLVVRLRASEPIIDGRTAAGRTVASINLDTVAEVTDTTGEAYTAAYGMLVSESPTGDHGALPPKPERDEGPHLSYALQWYVFIIIALLGMGYAARQEFRGLNADSDEVRAQDERAAARKLRRGKTDADIEDELLDA